MSDEGRKHGKKQQDTGRRSTSLCPVCLFYIGFKFCSSRPTIQANRFSRPASVLASR